MTYESNVVVTSDAWYGAEQQHLIHYTMHLLMDDHATTGDLGTCFEIILVLA